MIVVFNGPPGSGKDEACSYLKNIGFKQIEFKNKLFEDCIKYYNVSSEWFFEGYTREQKEIPEEKLGGLSRRSALIHVSENVIKPNYGNDYYGFMASKEMEEDIDYCISDGGFVEELSHIINKFGDDFLIIRLYRENSNFNLDSRRYINFTELLGEHVCGYKTTNVSELELQSFDKTINVSGGIIHNNGSKAELYKAINAIMKEKNDRQNNNKQ